MVLLLTVLSVIAVWLLLLVLLVGLVLIIRRLEAVRGRLRQIAMGVRAIEHQTAPLGPSSSLLAADLHRTGEALAGSGTALSAMEQQLIGRSRPRHG